MQQAYKHTRHIETFEIRTINKPILIVNNVWTAVGANEEIFGHSSFKLGLVVKH